MSDRKSEQKQRLDRISPSFCAAKWRQVTIDLVHGTTHSCHHPKRHAVPLTELRKNPAALHNTEFKKEQRRLMQDGRRPPECSYCWDVEDLHKGISDRIHKSFSSWADPDLENLAQLPWQQDVAPFYLEVMLDNICNFSCVYCTADVSTGVAAELRRHGPYSFETQNSRSAEFADRSREKSLYAEAFQAWFPTIVKDLKIYRLTGGEPLLSAETWRSLDSLLELGHPQLTLSINSHFSHPHALILRLADQVTGLLREKKIEKFELFVSLDTSGLAAEYIRQGLQYGKVLENLRKFSSLVPSAQIVIMCTFGILSFGGFESFLADLVELKKSMPLKLDVSILKNPDYLSAAFATPDLVDQLRTSLSFMRQDRQAFADYEIEKVETLLTWICAQEGRSDIGRLRVTFYKFIHEFARRQGRKFDQAHPEYAGLLRACKSSCLDLLTPPPLDSASGVGSAAD